jgi:hypothetical protein
MRIPRVLPLQIGGLPQPRHRVEKPLTLQQLGHQLEVRDPARPQLHTATPTARRQPNSGSAYADGRRRGAVTVVAGFLATALSRRCSYVLLAVVVLAPALWRSGCWACFSPRPSARSDLPLELTTQARVDNVDFVTNEEPRSVLAATSATPEQVGEAVAINEDARLRPLQASFDRRRTSLPSAFPASRLPKCVPGELSAADIGPSLGAESDLGGRCSWRVRRGGVKPPIVRFQDRGSSGFSAGD